MNKLFFLFLILPLFAVSQEENENSDKIYWSDKYQLEWPDFKGEEQSGEKIAALSSIGIVHEYTTDGEGVLNVSIDVCFIRSESWYKKNQEHNVLLKHEQLHFDIAEMHRRMIVKELSEANLTKYNYKEKLETTIEKIWTKDYRLTQDKYDSETAYSRMIKPQINWNKYVSKQLKSLEKYASTELELSLINFD